MTATQFCMERTEEMELGPLIARGRTAEVYRWAKGRVIKLFQEDMPFDAIEREYIASRFVYESGLPVPCVGELLCIGNRWGIEYEEITGVTLLQHVMQAPCQFSYVPKLLADLHMRVHKLSVPKGRFSSLKSRLDKTIQSVKSLDESTKAEIRKRLSGLAEDSVLCHYDFHPENVMLTESGPIIIDWMNTVTGDPAGDVARTWVILSQAGSGGIPVSQEEFKAFQARMAEEYLARYLEAGYLSREAIERWILPVAAARLAERISSEEDNLLRLIQSLL